MSNDPLIKAKIRYGIVTPRGFGPLGPNDVLLDPETGFITPVDCFGDPMHWYKAFAGHPVTLRNTADKNMKWTGFLACKETRGNALYIKDLIQVPA